MHPFFPFWNSWDSLRTVVNNSVNSVIAVRNENLRSEFRVTTLKFTCENYGLKYCEVMNYITKGGGAQLYPSLGDSIGLASDAEPLAKLIKTHVINILYRLIY